MENEWTKERVKQQLKIIEAKGFIPIPPEIYRKDDGVIGQLLEREFGVSENNLHIADLGTYELKGARNSSSKKQGKLTLFHKTSTSGLKPVEIFERFCYVARSRRNGELKRKLFTTVKGNRVNNRGFILKPSKNGGVDLYYKDEYLASWDFTDGEHKIKQVLLAFAETQGSFLSRDEKFHFTKAFILGKPKRIDKAIEKGVIALEFCIDQPIDGNKSPHDRGPHIRIPFNKLSELFDDVEEINLI